MKSSLGLLSRVGTVAVAVGLALLLVSFIPPARTSSFSSSVPVFPLTFRTMTPSLPPLPLNITVFNPFSTLTPQQELKVDITCNGTLEVYLLKQDSIAFQNKIGNASNASLLNDYIQANPSIVGLEKQITQEGAIDYVPTEIVNATVVFSNPSQNIVSASWQGSVYSLLGPASKAQLLAEVLIPIGVILALPWFIGMAKSRRKSN